MGGATETDANNRALGIVPKHITLGDIITRYKDEVTPSNRSARSEIIRLERFLKHKICNIPATDLQPHHFAEWRDERLTQIQGNSVNRELSTISAALTYAVKEWQYAKDNPILQISRPKKNQPRTRRPTEEETRRICAYLEYDENTPPKLAKQRVALAFLYAMETGMRAGEICSIQPHNIHLHERYVHLSITKNGSSRDVPQNRRALEILQKLIPLNFDHTFGLNVKSLDVTFRRATKALEIDDLHGGFGFEVQLP
ncbi:tyrosine-type recombinase/integrase [Neisseria canis]|uniref:Integrase n=1 Tax=Neisseria canis TaxID=493 RepID=A0A448D8G5_9NEIS|nr:tyrosine-type recombinase/integrase [Neisseria canis]VEF01441.1 integrase [Neisseria canis]